MTPFCYMFHNMGASYIQNKRLLKFAVPLLWTYGRKTIITGEP